LRGCGSSSKILADSLIDLFLPFVFLFALSLPYSEKGEVSTAGYIANTLEGDSPAFLFDGNSSSLSL
jgi:hypothetical protein